MGRRAAHDMNGRHQHARRWTRDADPPAGSAVAASGALSLDDGGAAPRRLRDRVAVWLLTALIAWTGAIGVPGLSGRSAHASDGLATFLDNAFCCDRLRQREHRVDPRGSSRQSAAPTKTGGVPNGPPDVDHDARTAVDDRGGPSGSDHTAAPLACLVARDSTFPPPRRGRHWVAIPQSECARRSLRTAGRDPPR